MVSALNQAVIGIMGSQNRFAESSARFINSFTPALGASSGDMQAVDQLSQLPNPNQNPFEGMGNISGRAIVASAMGGLFSPSATDPAAAMLDMMQAQYGFSANLSSFESISDTEQELLNILA